MYITSLFSYEENFKPSLVEKLPDKLKVSDNSSELLLLIRLLSGAIKFVHLHSGKAVLQKCNYFSSDMEGYAQYWQKKFPALIGDDYTAVDLAEYVGAVRFKNRRFYKEILAELTNYFLHESRGSHTASFVYLYRVLEKISYAFPLVYVSKSDDFLNTYGYLKDLMSDAKSAGELGFFKKFVKVLYSDDPLGESSVDFSIVVDEEHKQLQLFDLLRSLCAQSMIAESTDSPRLLSIKFTEVGSFIVTIRNKFFHYMNGGASNIDSGSMIDSDLFFSLINRRCMYWLSTVFLGILSQNIDDFERNKV